MLANAQAAFDRVEHISAPPLPDASACVQTQAAMLSVALPAEESELHYRKGFCELAVGAMTHSQSTFADAAAELDLGGASMLAWLARRAGNLPEQAVWKEPDFCPISCQPLVPVAKLWKGWIVLQGGDAIAAAVQFDALPNSGWPAYVEGLLAFRGGRYAESTARYREAVDIWTRMQLDKDAPLSVRLSPPRDIPELLTELGGAQIVNREPKAAIATLDRALEASPKARAYFLRARAKELTGQAEAAQADYNLASRAAFADANDLASGEAPPLSGNPSLSSKRLHPRRRGVLQRIEFRNQSHLAARRVGLAAACPPSASGSCGASREFLERSLASVSPFFPKDEAKSKAAGCPAGPAL